MKATVLPKSILVKVKGKKVSKLTLVKGKKVKLVVTVKPAKASQKVVFYSSNKKVVAVSANGLVKAKKAGKAKLTIKTKDGSKKKVIAVQVKKK